MKTNSEAIKNRIEIHLPSFGDGASTLTMLHERHNENNTYYNEQIKADFIELYQQMNGMPLREMDSIIYPGCKHRWDYEKAELIVEIKLD